MKGFPNMHPCGFYGPHGRQEPAFCDRCCEELTPERLEALDDALRPGGSDAWLCEMCAAAAREEDL